MIDHPEEPFPELRWRTADYQTLDRLFGGPGPRGPVAVHVDVSRMAAATLSRIADGNAAARFERAAVPLASHLAGHAAYWRSWWTRRGRRADVFLHHGMGEAEPGGMPGYNRKWKMAMGLAPMEGDAVPRARRAARKAWEDAARIAERISRAVAFMHVVDAGRLVKEMSFAWFASRMAPGTLQVIESASPVAAQMALLPDTVVHRPAGRRSRLLDGGNLMGELGLADMVPHAGMFPLLLAIGGDRRLCMSGRPGWRPRAAARRIAGMVLNPDVHWTPEALFMRKPHLMEVEHWNRARSNYAALAPENLAPNAELMADAPLDAELRRADRRDDLLAMNREVFAEHPLPVDALCRG